MDILSNQFFGVKKTFEEWQELSIPTGIVDSSLIPFKKWVSGKKDIGVGLTGNNAYDYSGEVVGIHPNEREMVLNALLDDIYTGQVRPSYMSHVGWSYPSYLDKIREHIYEALVRYCPFPHYLDEEATEENDEAFDWQDNMEYLVEDFLKDVTFRDIVVINQ